MKLALIALLIACSIAAEAQQYLYLKKGNEFPAHRFGLSEKVTFRTQGEEAWSSGRIDDISAESIRINGVRYPLDEIMAFRTRNAFLDVVSQVLWKGTLLFGGIVVVNGLINNDRPLITGAQAAIGTGLVGAGFLLAWLNRKTYEREEGWQWVVIDLNQNAYRE